jgi:hypothetical protein
MRAILPGRMSPRFWISILIAGLLIESWVISKNLVQPGQLEIAAEEVEPQKKALGERPAPKVEAGDEQEGKTESFDKADKGGLPSGWASWKNKDSLVEVSTAKALSAPNALAITGPSPGIARAWMIKSRPADVQISAAVMLDTLIPAYVFVRGNKLDGLAPSFYAVTAARGMEIQLVRSNGGKLDTLAKLKSTSYFSGKWAQVTINVNGKSIRARIQSLDSNQYLNAQGSWQAAPAWALDVNDAEISGGGLVGLGRWISYAGTIFFDDFQVGPPGGDTPLAKAVPEKLADKNRPPAKGQMTKPAKPVKGAMTTPAKPDKAKKPDKAEANPTPPPADAKKVASSDLPRPSLPRHYPHIRIAMLAYSGNPMGAIEDQLLKESVDLVVANDRYHDHIRSLAPNTPQLIYINTSNLYLDLLTDWMRYADANEVSREAAFYHAAQAKPFRGDSPSSKPVTWFWSVLRGSQKLADLTTAARGKSGSAPFGGSGESLYLGQVDRFREINLELTSGAKDSWMAELEYPSAVEGEGKSVTWTKLDILDDSTSGFARSGQFLFDPPADWKPVSLAGSPRLYFIRFRTASPGSPPVVRSVLGRDYVQAKGKNVGVIPNFDTKADLDHDGYLNGEEFEKHAPGKEARFIHETRMPTESYGQMRFCVNVSNPHFREWAVDYCFRELQRCPNVAGLFMDNSDGKTPVQPKEVIEPVSEYAADYGAMLQEISRKIAPHWILANTAGGQVRADPVVTQNPIYFEEFAIRPMSHHWGYFEDLAGMVARRAALTDPSPLAVIDSHPQNGSPTDPRMQLATLAYYYLIADPDSTVLMFYGGFEPNTTWSRHWCPAVAFDVGKPVGKWFPFASGNDPAGSGMTYHIYQRAYDNALVLYKPLSYARGSKTKASLGDETATKHDLLGDYRPLSADGTLGNSINTISLRNGEGAILVKSK